jgi:hypothetical protein
MRPCLGCSSHLEEAVSSRTYSRVSVCGLLFPHRFWVSSSVDLPFQLQTLTLSLAALIPRTPSTHRFVQGQMTPNSTAGFAPSLLSPFVPCVCSPSATGAHTYRHQRQRGHENTARSTTEAERGKAVFVFCQVEKTRLTLLCLDLLCRRWHTSLALLSLLLEITGECNA